MAKEVLQADLPVIRVLLHQLFADSEYTDLERMGGMTNHTYKVTLTNGNSYVVRVPGDGTEELINRRDEKCSTELACKIGIDAPLLHFGTDGTKVSQYIEGAQTMSVHTMRDFENLIRAAKVLRRLHTCGEDTGVPFEVFDMAAAYEQIIHNYGVPLYEDFETVKAQILEIKQHVDAQQAVSKVPCHNDALCENWVLGGNGRMYLIDWEYAGMNDCMWDLADVSIEAGLSLQHDACLLEAYFDRPPTVAEQERFRANKLYLDFLWTLWGKARVPFDGDEMEAYASERYLRLKKNLQGY